MGSHGRCFGYFIGVTICSHAGRMCFGPKLVSDFYRIDADLAPPSDFTARLVQFTMMDAAKRYGEFVADLETEPARLGETQMVGVAWLPSADQTGVRSNKAKMIFVPQPARFWQIKPTYSATIRMRAARQSR